MYGIFESQREITKNNGKLCSIDDAIKLAAGEFFTDSSASLVHGDLTKDQAFEVLKSKRCELCNAQFWAIGAGYCAYMFAAVEYDVDDDGNMIPCGYDLAEWITPGGDDDDD